MSALQFIFLDNTSNVKLKGLQSAIDDSYINDATVVMTLKDPGGVDVVGETWPMTMQYQAGTNGNYSGSFSHQATLVENDEYEALIVATLTDGSRAQWVEPVLALVRNNNSQ